jgi:molecular chaperone GrpE
MKDKNEKQECQENDETVAVATENDNLTAQLAEAQDKAAEYLDAARRVQAEFENYRKRTLTGEKTAYQEGINEMLLHIIGVTDTVDAAQNMVKDKQSAEGVALIGKQLAAILQKYGVKEISAAGEPFNPDFHNALMREETEGQEEKVIQVFQKGYIRAGKVLRYATVKVG